MYWMFFTKPIVILMVVFMGFIITLHSPNSDDINYYTDCYYLNLLGKGKELRYYQSVSGIAI